MENRTVLVVDDEPTVRHTIGRLLARHNWRVLVANSGRAALEMAALNQPDIVVLDVCLPGIDGFEVCRRMRADARLSRTPVLFLSGLNQPDSAMEGYAVGGDVYLNKPLQASELRMQLDSLLMRSRQAPAPNPLTGLPGGQSLMLETERRLGLNEASALLRLEINGFTSFADRRGATVGEEALRTAAQILKAVTFSGAFAAHLGGNDFALLCREDDAQPAAAQVCLAFDSVFGPLNGLSLAIGVALGSRMEAPSYAALAQRAAQLKQACAAKPSPSSRWLC